MEPSIQRTLGDLPEDDIEHAQPETIDEDAPTPPNGIPTVPPEGEDFAFPEGFPDVSVSLLNAEVQPPHEIPTPPLPSQTQPTTTTSFRMAAFYYCEKCEMRIADAKLEAGRARDKKRQRPVHCTCFRAKIPRAYGVRAKEEPAKVRSKPTRRPSSKRLPALKAVPGGPQSSGSRLAARAQKRPLRGTGSRSSGLAMGAVGAVIILMVALLFLSYGISSTTDAKRPPTGSASRDHGSPPQFHTQVVPTKKRAAEKTPSDSNVTTPMTKNAAPETPATENQLEKPDTPPVAEATPLEAGLKDDILEEAKRAQARHGAATKPVDGALAKTPGHDVIEELIKK